MMEADPLAQGMFWGGLLVAAVPIGLTVGVGIYLLRRYLRERDLRWSDLWRRERWRDLRWRGEKEGERESRPLEGGPPRTTTS